MCATVHVFLSLQTGMGNLHILEEHHFPINQVIDLLKNQILQRLQGTKELIRGAAGALNDAGDIVLLRDERRPSLASNRHSSQSSHAAGRVKGREG